MISIVFAFVVIAFVKILLQVPVQGRLSIDNLMNLPKTPTTLTEVISIIPAMIEDDIHFQLHYIYDEHYQDAIHSPTAIPVSLSGITMADYGKSQEALGWILTPVADEAIVILLCSADQAIEIFQWINLNKFRDTLTLWILVINSSDEELWFRQGLEELVLEGTRIVFLTRIFDGNYRISISGVDVDGTTRFNEVIQTLNETIITESPRRLSPLVSLFPDDQLLFSDLKGRTLNVTANHVLLYAHLGPVNEDGIIEEHSGLEFSLLEALSDKLNFSFDVVKNTEGGWGNLQPDGTATGMIGMVYRGEVDLALPLISITRSRSRAVDYTTPYLYEPKAIFSRAPAVKASPFIIFSPFTLEVWLSIIGVMLSMGSILQLLSKIIQTPFGTFQQTIFNTFRSIVNQGELLSEDTPWTLRTTFYSWYLFCIVILAHYSGTLVSMLAIPSREKPIDSLMDLPRAVSKGFTVGATRGTYIAYMFRDATDGIYRDTWLLFNHDDLSQSLVASDEGFDMVSQKKFAFINVRSVIEAEAIMRGRENYHVSREEFSGTWVGLVMTKGAPYKANFDRATLQMVEGGLINKWRSDEHRRLEKMDVQIKNSGPMAMRIEYLQAAFYVLLFGDLVATAAFAIERTFDVQSLKK